MTTLTSTELAELEAFIPATLNDFKTAYFLAKAGSVATPAEEYYSYLSSKGFAYGDSALAVVLNSTRKARIANGYAERTAAEHVDLSYESDAWLEVQWELMRGDHQLRVANLGDDLSFQDQLDNHAAAHLAVGAPVETFTSHVPLSQIAEYDPVLAEAVWQEIIDQDGFKDSWFEDGLKLGFTANINANQPFNEVMADYADQLAWGWRLGVTIAFDIAAVDLAALCNDYGQDFEDSVVAFQDLVTDLFGAGEPEAASWVDALAAAAAAASGGQLLPEWIEAIVSGWNNATAVSSPLVLDLDGDGVELTTFNAATTATFFDLDNNGIASQTAWVGADDGLLSRDLNANGVIDDASELFGTATVDGFAILSELDSNDDLVIDTNDAAWGDLRVWHDADVNALTGAGELVTLSSLGIESISLSGVTPSTSTISGNPISHTSTYTLTGGSTRAIVDAWFVHDEMNTHASEDYQVDLRTLFLPTLRGFGSLGDLHVAMSANGTLLDLVKQFVLDWSWDRLAESAALDHDVEDILHEWADLTGVSPTSRGPNVDARHLEFLEAFFGDDFYQVQRYSQDPFTAAGAMIEAAWDDLLVVLKASLILQSGAGDIFQNTAVYNPWSGDFEGTKTLSQTAIAGLVANATASGVNTLEYWKEVWKFVNAVKGADNVTATEEGWLDQALDDSGLMEIWDDLAPPAPSLDEHLIGTTGVDTLAGNGGDDLIEAGAGADTLDGGTGNDELWGEAGNDTLTGGAGGDLLYGGADNDTYVFGEGDDFIHDTGGTADKIVLAAGIVPADLTFYRVNNANLLIAIAGGGSIEILGHHFNPSYRIETIEFNDPGDGTINLTSPLSLQTHGTDDADNLEDAPLGANDTIYGYGGDDYIEGGSGTDTIDGGSGNDELRGGADNDTYIFSPGFDTIHDGTGTDTLVIPDGYGAGDLSLVVRPGNPGYQDLVVFVEGLGQAIIKQQFHATSASFFETISFANGTDASIDLATYEYTIEGTDSAETLTGTQRSDMIYGEGGDDTINAQADDDTAYGGLGNDTINGEGDNDVLYGEDGTDTLNGGDGDDDLYGGADNDNLSGGNGNDFLDGGAGTDTLNGGAGVDIYALHSTIGVDSITDINGNGGGVLVQGGLTLGQLTIYRKVEGSAQDLIIEANPTNYVVLNDWFSTSLGELEFLYIEGGSTYSLRGSTLILNGAGSFYSYGTESADTFTSLGSTIQPTPFAQVMYGYGGNDAMSGGSGDDTMYGGNDNDGLTGGSGADTLDGGAGSDTHTGEAGNDTYIASAGLDTITDTSGTDKLVYYAGLDPAALTYTVNGNNAKFTVAAGTDEITINLQNQSAIIDSIEFADGYVVNSAAFIGWTKGTSASATHTGSSGNNTIVGNGGSDTLNGVGGNDTLIANTGADTLDGGTGNDTLYAGAGNDTLIGGDNDDVLYAGADDDSLAGGNGNDALHGGAGNDTATFASASGGVTANLATGSASGQGTDTMTGIENLTGSGHNDTLTGDSGANALNGGNGNDTIVGGAGDDTIDGGSGTDTADYSSAGSGVAVDLTAGTSSGAGNDTLAGMEKVIGSAYADTLTGDGIGNELKGGAGNDQISGEGGLDDLYGEDGADVFLLESASAFANVDVIKDFDTTENDVIDISDVLDTHFDPMTDNIIDFVQITTNGANSELRVDTTGTATFGAGTLIATIEGVTGLTDEAALVTSGHLLAA
jgi:Ca2+-binding RTX toxin-like protein